MSFGVRCNAMLVKSTFVSLGTVDVTSNVGDSGFSSTARGWIKSSLFGDVVWFDASLFDDKTGVSAGGVEVTLFMFGVVEVVLAKSLVSTLQNLCDAAVNQCSATPGLPPPGVTFTVTSSLFDGCCVCEFIWKTMTCQFLSDSPSYWREQNSNQQPKNALILYGIPRDLHNSITRLILPIFLSEKTNSLWMAFSN